MAVAGEFVFVSGQVAWDSTGDIVGAGSVARQTEQVFDNLEHALRAAGSGLDRLVRIGVYLTSEASIPAFRAVRDQRLRRVRPTSTVLIVKGLVDPGLLVELDAVALR